MRRGSLRREIICGVDEAGRGPLAGPVVAAAVVLDPDNIIAGLADSKLLTPARRFRIFSEIIDKSAGYGIVGVSCSIIDKINILQASLLAMRRAVEKLTIRLDKIFVDGNFKIPGLNIPQQAVVDGDKYIAQISAASILAKVARDAYMTELSNIYPEYGFERHKGYGTKTHIKLLKKFGPCPVHRRSFSPVAQMALWE